MPKHLGYRSSGGSNGDGVLIEVRRFEAARRNSSPQAAADASPTDQEQLARDLEDIERATAALRRAEPALETWTDPPPAALRQPGPVWLLIGLLWLSTALLTVGAVAAIARLVG